MRKELSNYNDWFEFAKADLDSATILLNKTSNFHIVAFHSHQVVEKTFKGFILKNNKTFPFIHELIELLKKVNEIENINYLLEDVSFLMDLYTNTRYPDGDNITKQDAQKSVKIASKIFEIFEKK